MRRGRDLRLLMLCLLACGGAYGDATSSSAPSFTAAGIVQGASQTAGTLAPNTIATIYGNNLSWTTEAVADSDLNHGILPTTLDSVIVYVNNLVCHLLYVSPTQINFLIPYEITAASATVVVARQGIAGPLNPDDTPAVTIPLAPTAPAFFEWNGNFAVAEHADGSLISPDAPAHGGDIVVLYAAGLGRTVPDVSSGALPQAAATILYASQLQILLNGNPLAPEGIYYAGVTPGFAGLYQINLLLPDPVPANPLIQIVIGSQSSPPEVQLYAN